IAAIIAVAFANRQPAASRRIVRFSLPAPSLTFGRLSQPAISADGRMVAYADQSGATPGIRVRWIDRAELEVLPGTEDATDVTFAPNGRAIAYVSGRDASLSLRTISVDGRSATQLTAGAATTSGVAWGRD